MSRHRSSLRRVAPAALALIVIGGLAGPALAGRTPRATAAEDRLTPVTQSVP